MLSVGVGLGVLGAGLEGLASRQWGGPIKPPQGRIVLLGLRVLASRVCPTRTNYRV